MDRLGELIEHTYGRLEFASKHVQQELLSRVQTAEQNFRETVGSAAMQVANAAERGDTADAWSRWRREYNAAVRPGEYDHETRVEIHYQPTDAADERSMLRQLALAWEQTHDDPVRHLTVTYTRADGEQRRIRDTWRVVDNLQVAAQRVDDARNAQARREAEDVDWEAWAERERRRAGGAGDVTPRVRSPAAEWQHYSPVCLAGGARGFPRVCGARSVPRRHPRRNRPLRGRFPLGRVPTGKTK